MADTKISALTSASALGGTEIFPGVQSAATVGVTAAQIAAFVAGTANVFTTLQTFTIGAANTGVIASTGYSLTGSNATGMIDLAGTWNTTGNPTAIKLNITVTAAGSSSKFLDFQTGGTSRFSIGYSGSNTTVSINAGNVTLDGSSGITVVNSRNLAFTGTFAGRVTWSDVGLSRAAAGVLEVDNASTGGAALQFIEQTAPTGAANTARIYAVDNGGGKTQLMVIFGSGAAQQIAIEP